MTYLIDANIWLEAILDRDHADEVTQFLKLAPRGTLATTDYTLHSIALYLYRDRPDMFRSFLDDLVRLSVNTLHLAPSSLLRVLDVSKASGLDFDDAFQYVAAERDNLRIVSLDSDFDRIPRGRLTPTQALAELQSQEKR